MACPDKEGTHLIACISNAKLEKDPCNELTSGQYWWQLCHKGFYASSALQGFQCGRMVAGILACWLNRNVPCAGVDKCIAITEHEGATHVGPAHAQNERRLHGHRCHVFIVQKKQQEVDKAS